MVPLLVIIRKAGAAGWLALLCFLLLYWEVPRLDAADNNEERSKDSGSLPESKKKQETETKADGGGKPSVEEKVREEKPKTEDKGRTDEKAKAEDKGKIEDKGKTEEKAKIEEKAKPEEKAKAEDKGKGDDKAKSEDKSKVEEKAKSEDKAKPEEPQAKTEDAGKKPVTSLNLTIKLTLMADPLLFPFDIEVEMDNRKAVLSGNVPTEEEKSRAADIVKKIDGVDAVVNKLTPSPALRASLVKKQDETIAHLVRDRLARSETLKAVGFDVKAENGVVLLSGKTRFQVIALEAAEAARHIPGVRAVNTSGVQIITKE